MGNSEVIPVYSGLAAGDEIVISNLRLVTQGQQVHRAATTPEG